nr:P22AR C-terminal domain-containing protein [Erwinia phyllosphaerae]
MPVNLCEKTNMNIVAKSEMNFHGVNLTPVSNMNGIWLTSADVAKALHYNSTKSVTNLFNQYSDEFSPGMTMVIESVTNGLNGSSRRIKVRVFSLRGAHLIAMFARTPVAKEFRRWVLDVLDQQPCQSPVASQFTDDELRDLCWLWKASAVMANRIEEVEPLLRIAEHRLAGSYYSMPREYSRTINKARKLLERETSHVEESYRDDDWRVLHSLRAGRIH